MPTAPVHRAIETASSLRHFRTQNRGAARASLVALMQLTRGAPTERSSRRQIDVNRFAEVGER
ncbi:MAG: hypothetical protein ACRC1G_08355 [Bradyrhizobium sp.]